MALTWALYALDMGLRHGVADPVGLVVEAAGLVRHGVHATQARVVEGHAGQELGVGHLLAGVQIIPRSTAVRRCLAIQLVHPETA